MLQPLSPSIAHSCHPSPTETPIAHNFKLKNLAMFQNRDAEHSRDALEKAALFCGGADYLKTPTPTTKHVMYIAGNNPMPPTLCFPYSLNPNKTHR